MPLKILSATLAERALPQYSDLLAALTQQNSAKAKSFYCNATSCQCFIVWLKRKYDACFPEYIIHISPILDQISRKTSPVKKYIVI